MAIEAVENCCAYIWDCVSYPFRACFKKNLDHVNDIGNSVLPPPFCIDQESKKNGQFDSQQVNQGSPKIRGSLIELQLERGSSSCVMPSPVAVDLVSTSGRGHRIKVSRSSGGVSSIHGYSFSSSSAVIDSGQARNLQTRRSSVVDNQKEAKPEESVYDKALRYCSIAPLAASSALFAFLELNPLFLILNSVFFGASFGVAFFSLMQKYLKDKIIRPISRGIYVEVAVVVVILGMLAKDQEDYDGMSDIYNSARYGFSIVQFIEGLKSIISAYNSGNEFLSLDNDVSRKVSDLIKKPMPSDILKQDCINGTISIFSAGCGFLVGPHLYGPYIFGENIIAQLVAESLALFYAGIRIGYIAERHLTSSLAPEAKAKAIKILKLVGPMFAFMGLSVFSKFCIFMNGGFNGFIISSSNRDSFLAPDLIDVLKNELKKITVKYPEFQQDLGFLIDDKNKFNNCALDWAANHVPHLFGPITTVLVLLSAFFDSRVFSIIRNSSIALTACSFYYLDYFFLKGSVDFASDSEKSLTLYSLENFLTYEQYAAIVWCCALENFRIKENGGPGPLTNFDNPQLFVCQLFVHILYGLGFGRHMRNRKNLTADEIIDAINFCSQFSTVLDNPISINEQVPVNSNIALWMLDILKNTGMSDEKQDIPSQNDQHQLAHKEGMRQHHFFKFVDKGGDDMQQGASSLNFVGPPSRQVAGVISAALPQISMLY